jgi:hypothetical protein
VVQARTYMHVFMDQVMSWIPSSFTGRAVEKRKITGSFYTALPCSTTSLLPAGSDNPCLGISCAGLKIKEP